MSEWLLVGLLVWTGPVVGQESILMIDVPPSAGRVATPTKDGCERAGAGLGKAVIQASDKKFDADLKEAEKAGRALPRNLVFVKTVSAICVEFGG